jgi:hypothetical protein
VLIVTFFEKRIVLIDSEILCLQSDFANLRCADLVS